MSKIIAPNKHFSGLRAGIPFVNGESETENEYLKGWFKENGYQVIDDVSEEKAPEPDQEQESDMENADELEKLKKDELQTIASGLNLEFTEKTNKAELIEMIKVAREMEE